MSSTHLPKGSLATNSKLCQTWLNTHSDLKVLASEDQLIDLTLKIQSSATTSYTNVALLLN